MAAKLRIPKIYSGLKSNDHPCEKDAVWKAAMDTARQPSNEAIYRLLDDDTKEQIGEDEIWVTVSLINLMYS